MLSVLNTLFGVFIVSMAAVGGFQAACFIVSLLKEWAYHRRMQNRAKELINMMMDR